MDQTDTPLALVTGASTGIGRALAREFAEHGFDVVVIADEAAVHDAAREVEGLGRRAFPVEADLATARGVDHAWGRVTATGRIPEIAALNAGMGVNGRFDRTPLEDDLALVDLNVRSTVHLAKLVTRQMVTAERGRLLITSSIAAVAPSPYHATYAASKAFVHSFAEGIRTELEGTGVTVTSLMPGPTETEFFSRADMEDTRIGRMEAKDDARDVARDAYEALMAGKASVVSGSFMNRLGVELGTHLPDALAAPIFARMTRPGG
jgi:uncharacterized protein